MPDYSWRMIDRNGEIRLQEKLHLTASGELWPKLAAVAVAFGRMGEHLQVVDETDNIVVRVGVATAVGLAGARKDFASRRGGDVAIP